MPQSFKPRCDVLPQAQREIWPLLAPSRELSFVLYGGTAIALHLGHRRSLDFDFFRSQSLEKNQLAAAFKFMPQARTIHEDANTLVVAAGLPSGLVKASFFGGIDIGRVNDPLKTSDGNLLVASLEDLMATKLQAILDRSEAKDYRDIAAMLSAGVSLPRGLGAFSSMYGKDPALPLRALGYFGDGDLSTLADADKILLRSVRDRVVSIPRIALVQGSLAGDR